MDALASLRLDNPSYAQLLIDHGVVSTVKDGGGLSALSLALKGGTFRLARLLIENGARLTEQGIFGVTPIGECSYLIKLNSMMTLPRHSCEQFPCLFPITLAVLSSNDWQISPLL
jgi:hypothetical protein